MYFINLVLKHKIVIVIKKNWNKYLSFTLLTSFASIIFRSCTFLINLYFYGHLVGYKDYPTNKSLSLYLLFCLSGVKYIPNWNTSIFNRQQRSEKTFNKLISWIYSDQSKLRVRLLFNKQRVSKRDYVDIGVKVTIVNCWMQKRYNKTKIVHEHYVICKVYLCNKKIYWEHETEFRSIWIYLFILNNSVFF